MLKTKALKKIFTTTLSMFIILTVFTIPTTTKGQNVLRTNLEIEDITNLSTDKIYLLNKNNLLVKTDVFIEKSSQTEKIIKIIDYLTENNNKVPSGLNGYLPKNTKVLNTKESENTIIINFSKEFLNYKKEIENQLITGIVYSILENTDYENVWLTVEEKKLEEYPKPLNKNIGINNQYILTNRKDLSRVVVYYLTNIDENSYYVPVTKYLNDNREKIEVIIDELCNDSSNNELISYLNGNTKLLDYKEESDVLFLNFNDYLLDSNDTITKDILNTIAYSVFANYDVNTVMFEVNSEEINYISRKNLLD